MGHEDTSQQVRDSLLKDSELRARVSLYVDSDVIEAFLSNREHDPDYAWECFMQHQDEKQKG